MLILFGESCKADKVHIKDVSGFYEITLPDINQQYLCHLNRVNDSLYSVCISTGLTANSPCVTSDSSYFIFSTEKGIAHGKIAVRNGCNEIKYDVFRVSIEYKNGHEVKMFVGNTNSVCCYNSGSLGQPEPNAYTPCNLFIRFWKYN